MKSLKKWHKYSFNGVLFSSSFFHEARMSPQQHQFLDMSFDIFPKNTYLIKLRNYNNDFFDVLKVVFTIKPDGNIRVISKTTPLPICVLMHTPDFRDLVLERLRASEEDHQDIVIDLNEYSKEKHRKAFEKLRTYAKL
jgi:hypothetical protein